MTDVAMLHSTLFSAGLFHASNTGVADNIELGLQEYLTHKIKTIKVINTRMADMSKALTDETLGAITLLITAITSRGDCHEINVHMKG
jgi:hypothetical protein